MPVLRRPVEIAGVKGLNIDLSMGYGYDRYPTQERTLAGLKRECSQKGNPNSGLPDMASHLRLL